MTIIIKLSMFLLNIIYCLFKLLPTKNKITFISRQYDEKSTDMKLLEKEIKKQDDSIKIVFLCKMINNKFVYAFHMLKQMYHIATSKIVILDGYCILISNLKHKKSLTVIQMWHALGAFKKFGYSILDQKEGSSSKTAKLMKMHKNYDYVIASGDGCIKPYSEAFDCDKSIIKVYPLPRIDLLTNINNINRIKNSVLKKYPELSNKKKTILYAPTFRKNEDVKDKVLELINSIDYKKYNLIIKMHPLTKLRIKDERVIFDNKFTTLEMMYLSNYVISDYSAIIYEASIINKPLYFWAYDKNKYLKERNFYLNYEKDLPGNVFTNINDLIKSIKTDKYDYDKLSEFRKKYVKETDNATLDLTKFIISCLNK